MRKKYDIKGIDGSTCSVRSVVLRLVLAGVIAGFSSPLSLSAQAVVPPPTQIQQSPQQAAQVPPRGQIQQGHFYPKNLAQQLLGARIRVNQTAGLRTITGFPPPANTAGTLDISSLLTNSFDGLELSPGFHSFTITLAKPVALSRVAFVNIDATGTFNVLIGASDPQLQPVPPTKQENAIGGPTMVNYAVFQPQMAKFIQIEFRVVKPGRIARLGAYGIASALDFAVRVAGDDTKGDASAPSTLAGVSGGKSGGPVRAPGAAPSLPPTKEVPVDMAGLASGARVSRVSSGVAGADPNQMISDSLGAPYSFNAADPSPTVDLDFKAKRKVSSASVLMSGPPCRVELIKSSAPPAISPSSGIATVTKASGVVELLSFDGTGQSAVKPGDILLPGRVLRTGFNSSAELDIDGKSLLRIGPNSNVTLRIGTESGAEVSVLRGTVLWQVFAPGGGGRLITPSSIATISGTTIIAEVKLNGASTISLLETSRADGVQISSASSGDRYTLHPGESVSTSGGGSGPAGSGSGLNVQPFIIQKTWDQSPVGASGGPLRNGVEQVFVPGGVVPSPSDGGEVLATTTTKGGLSEAKFDFAGQTLDGVRVKVTPMSGASRDIPITIVGLSVTGQYQVQDLDYTFHGQRVADLARAEGVSTPVGVAGAPASAAAAGTPAKPGATGTALAASDAASSAAAANASESADSSATSAAASSSAGSDETTVAQLADAGSGNGGEPILPALPVEPSKYPEVYPLWGRGGGDDPFPDPTPLPVNQVVVLPPASR